MIIRKFEGTDARMYALIAPLIMSVPIIRQNNNYPFKTSRKHTWFIAIHEGEVIGFMPVERLLKEARIDNYYVAGDDLELLKTLIELVKEEFAGVCSIYAISHSRHASLFRECGFSDVKEWRLYVKLGYDVDGEFKG